MNPQDSTLTNPAAPVRMSPLERRNTIIVGVGDSVWGLQGAMVASSTVLTVLLLQLGAGRGMVGVISAVESGAAVVPQLIGAYLFRSRRNRKQTLLVWHTLAIAPFIFANAVLLFFSPRLDPAVVRVGLLINAALPMIAVGLIIPAWVDWMSTLFDSRIRGTVIGISFGAASLMGVLGALYASWLIGMDSSAQGFYRHYLTAGFLVLVSMYLFWQLEDPHGTEGAPGATANYGEMIAHFLHSMRNVNFRAFLIGRTLSTLGFAILPFIAVHYMQDTDSGVSAGYIVSCGAAQSLMTAVFSLTLGRVGDRRGHRLGMIICCVMQFVTLVILLVFGGKVGCLLAYTAAGAALGSGSISHYNLLLETCPHDGRVAHISVGNVIISLVAIPAPLIAGLVAEVWGTAPLFGGCLLLSVAALAWFIWRMKEPRDMKSL